MLSEKSRPIKVFNFELGNTRNNLAIGGFTTIIIEIYDVLNFNTDLLAVHQAGQ